MPAIRNNKRIAGFVKFWLPVMAWMGLIFYASGLPAGDIPPLFPFQDIAFHLFVYSALALFFARALKNSRSALGPARLIFFTVIFAFLYALSDEFHQAFVPGRFASGLDIFIDSAGAFAGSIIYGMGRYKGNFLVNG